MPRCHEIGQIQGCGFIFVIEQIQDDASAFPSGFRIVGASRNVDSAQWIHASSTAEICGADLGRVFHGLCLKTVCSLVKRHVHSRSPSLEYLSTKANRNFEHIKPAFPKIFGDLPLTLTKRGGDDQEGEKGGREMTCTVASANPGFYLIEIEPKDDEPPRSANVKGTEKLLEVADVLGRVPLGVAPQVQTAALCDAFMEKYPAYDRIMVYQFASDDSGKVIHETIRPASRVASSYLDLHFPATDIPSKTRELLRRTGVRFIADTSAPGVPIDLLDDRVAVVDLSMSTLRASSECHLTYLRNMGVKSSLVVAITVDSQLWGLFSFHSYTGTVIPSCERRIMIEMAATITASLISSFERDGMVTTTLLLSRTLANVSNHNRVHSFLSAEYKSLLQILGLDSIVLSQAGQPEPVVYGNSDIALTSGECKELLNMPGSERRILFAPLESRGVAFFSVRSCVIAFVRGTYARHLRWAGKPDCPLHDQEKGHPRASFDLYLEKARVEIEPWSPATVDMLRMVRHGISSHLYEESLPADVEEIFAQVSHQLRTPLHGLMSSIELLRDGGSKLGAEERRELNESAFLCGSSLVSMLDDVLGIAKDRSSPVVARCCFEPSRPIYLVLASMTPLAAETHVQVAITNVVGSTQRPSFATSATAIHHRDNAGLNEVVGEERRINNIMHSLVSNAIKFSPVGGKVGVSLYVFNSLQNVADWWTSETDRFDAKLWMGASCDADGIKVLTGSESGGLALPVMQRWYVYCVEDSGVGIAKEDLSSLTKAYWQVSQGPRKQHQGTGLGLHLCKNHVDAMLGGLGVASTIAEDGAKREGGSLFAAALPLFCPGSELEFTELGISGPQSKEELDAGALAIQAARVVERLTSGVHFSEDDEIGNDADVFPGSRKKVAFLVVDDQKVNVKLLGKKIEVIFKSTHDSVQVLSATDARTALQVLTTARDGETKHDSAGNSDPTTVFAGIFMDYHMPNMDGVECTSKIRSLEVKKGWSRLPICGFTADLTEAARENFMGAGANTVIGKPWGPGQVERVCNDMLTTVLTQGGG